MRIWLLICILSVLAACSTSPSPLLPPKTLEPVANVFKIKRLWSVKIGDGADENYLRLTPVVAGERIYAVDYLGRVFAFDTRRSEIIWERDLNSPAGSPIVKVGDLLYLGTGKGKVFAIHTDDGKVVWEAQLASEILSAPAVDKGVVVVRAVNGDVVALDQKTGKRLWLNEERTPALTLRGTSTPIIYGDLVLSAYDDGKLKLMSLGNGKQIWETEIAVPRGRTDLERIVDLDATPVIMDDVIYTVAYQGRLAAVQLGSGRILWQRDIDSYLDFAVDAYRLYLINSNGEVWALDRSNGATLWKQDDLLRRGLTAPELVNDHLVVGDFNGYLHWLRRDNGKLEARVRMLEYDYSTPSLDETEDMNFPKSRDILARPLFIEDRLIAMDRFGRTEAFEILARK